MPYYGEVDFCGSISLSKYTEDIKSYQTNKTGGPIKLQIFQPNYWRSTQIRLPRLFILYSHLILTNTVPNISKTPYILPLHKCW